MQSGITTRLPAEWEPQAGIQLTWPHAKSDWAPILSFVETCYTNIARSIAEREPLLILCHDCGQVRSTLERARVDMNAVRLYEVQSNDTWARDYGPITVYQDGRPVLLDFEFNGWGGKYPAELDNATSAELQRQGAFGSLELKTIPCVLEGGSIDSDGRGTLLTTSRCLLEANRRHTDKGQVESTLREHLGAERVLWLNHGHLKGDDTDGHVDTLARFCSPDTIAYVECRTKLDEHHGDLCLMREDLENLRTPEGEPYRLVPLPLPHSRYDDEGSRLPATYANFLILNEAVLMPTYGVREDGEALEILRAVFPGREVKGIDCRSLIIQHGSLHCVTMQYPEGVPL